MAHESQFKTDVLKGIAFYSYAPRAFAYLAALLVVSAILKINNSPFQDSFWVLTPLFLVCLFWPHIAYYWAKAYKNNYRIVTNSLLFDSLFAGLWLPFLSFELIPCAVFITVLMINNISAGGFNLLIQGLLLMISSALLVSLLISPDISLESQFVTTLLCLPMIVFYPMVVAYINYKLTTLMLAQREKLLKISRHDDLTGLYSRRYWEQRLLQEFNRCQRSGESSCVMMVDIDYFKQINDTYGHLVGDNVLKQFGHIIQQLRSSDIPGRYGGEEFAILLPNSHLKECLFVAERLRKEVEETVFEDVHQCTVSIGIAPLSSQHTDAYKWLDEADRELYKAKNKGRNQVCSTAQRNDIQFFNNGCLSL